MARWGLRRTRVCEDLGDARGCYLLLLHLPDLVIAVGARGRIAFTRGVYGYVGSATGLAVTLAHRLRRHQHRRKTRHWHIDFLTTHRSVRVLGAYIAPGSRLSERHLAWLCWTRFAAIPGFGNSDRRGGAPGHLFLLHRTTGAAGRPC